MSKKIENIYNFNEFINIYLKSKTLKQVKKNIYETDNTYIIQLINKFNDFIPDELIKYKITKYDSHKFIANEFNHTVNLNTRFGKLYLEPIDNCYTSYYINKDLILPNLESYESLIGIKIIKKG